jgi:TolB-like protein/tetratricopeptide (TPR) repeat protein
VTPDRWKQVKEVLEAALGQPAEARAMFLTEACASDLELRAEVDSLLVSDDQANRFLETAAAPGVLRSFTERRPEALAGARIGPYKVLTEIAHGGMGAVYLAERDDSEYRRQVAIKLIKSDLGSTSAVRRFRQERQILADLDHPNIARLLDGGTTDDGLPYFVMEVVEGVPIDAYCEQRKLAAAQRLELFGIVCSAVAEAHRKRVVHLDLKPANVLVTAEGTPKLLDFGIAKLLSPELEAQRTATTGRLMTPEYASPEQLRAEPVTAASDIYALGVLLYRLLTGRGPYKVDSDLPHELARAICEQEPDPPSVCAGPQAPHRLTGDLDAIVLKALRKEPQRRYGSVEELSEDLRRHRQGLAVRARKDGLAYRAGKLVRRNKATAITALTMTALAALLSAVVSNWARITGASAPTTPAAISSLAVLPLANLSRDPEQEYFADGMTEALITDLSRIRSLRVISRTSVMRYKGAPKRVPEIARELKVDGVVEGSVLRSGDRVRITAHESTAPTDKHLWAQSYERNLRDVIALQSEVARAIVDEIQIKLTPLEQVVLAGRHPIKPEAYEDYLKGRYFWNKRTEGGLRKGIEYLEQAIEKEPGYALAYAGLADSYIALAGYRIRRPMEVVPIAKVNALKALEIDESLAEAHTSMGALHVVQWDLVAAEREFRRAIALNPNYATGHAWYAEDALAPLGRLDEAIAEVKRAQALDPTSLAVNAVVALVYYLARQYDQAVEQLRKTLEIEPGFAVAHQYLGRAYLQKAEHGQALAEFQRAAALSGGHPFHLAWLGVGYAQSGKKREATQVVGQLKALSRRQYVSAYEVAVIYAGLRQKDRAFEWLEKAAEEHSVHLPFLNVEPALDSLRSDPRFQDLGGRMGLSR